jgi:glycosyltransferase involved in cell wall biosynthesis
MSKSSGINKKPSRQVKGLDASGIQVIEFGAHELQLEHLSYLFEGATSLCIHYRHGRYGDSAEANFSEHTLKHAKFYSLDKGFFRATVAFYIGILRSTSRQDLVFISTGPEQRRWPDILFFLALVMFHGDRLILNIRRPEAWVRSSISSRAASCELTVRSFALRGLKRVTCEGVGSKDFLRRFSGDERLLVSHIPTQFSDYVQDKFQPHVDLEKKSPALNQTGRVIKIGLLGGLDSRRRDYSVLAEALTLLSAQMQQRITLVVLGRSTGKESDEIVRLLGRNVAVEQAPSQFLTKEEFYSRGLDCDILLSPLRTGDGYGSARGSGSYGDALALGKKLIIPKGVDPGGEYVNLSLTYLTASDLADLLSSILNDSHIAELQSEHLVDFSRNSVIARVRKELNLLLHFGNQ